MTDLCTRHFGADAVHAIDGGLRVETGTQPIHYLTPAAFAQRYHGLAMARRDDHAALLSFDVVTPDRVVALLRDSGIPHVRTSDGRVLVSAANACGVAIEFRTL